MKILKLLLLISAAATVILRLFSYENGSFVDVNTVRILNIVSIISGCICVLCALIWIIMLKKQEKAEKKKSADSE